MKNQLIIFLMFFYGSIFSQTKISVETAIEIALKNNNALKNEKLKTEYAKAIIKSSADLPKTTVFGEFGQINSNYNDTKFGISQSFAMPVVYKLQKQLLTEEYNSKVLQSNLKEFEVKKLVTNLFYNYLTLKEKEKLLQKADTLFAKFYEKTNMRLQKGESNILEKATAETQKTNVAIQIKQLQVEIELTTLEFQMMLNSNEKFLPYASDLKAKLRNLTLEENPKLILIKQQKQLLSVETLLHKSKLLPDVILAYNNNSFKGIGLNDSQRFHSAQLGLGIPLFGRSQRAKINASKIAEKSAEAVYQTEVLKLENEYAKLQTQYKSDLEIVSYFETNSNKNSKIIIDVAYKQFINGDINYLDFVMLINQSIAIQSSYIEAVTMLNESAILLTYLNSKN